MGKNPIKDKRHSNYCEINLQLQEYHSVQVHVAQIHFDENVSNNDDEDLRNKTAEKMVCNLHDLIMAKSSPKITPPNKSKGQKCSLLDYESKKYETPTRSKRDAVDVDNKQSNTSTTANYCFHRLLENSFEDLQRSNPWFHFSRLGENLRGSTKILCYDLKVAFFLIWSVHKGGFDVKVVPIVNSSSLTDVSLQGVSKKISIELASQFDEKLIQNKSKNEQEEQVFDSLNRFLLSRQGDVTDKLSNELSSLFQSDGMQSLGPLEKRIRTSNINIEHPLDYFDIFALKAGDSDSSFTNGRAENKHTAENEDGGACPICFEAFNNDGVYLRTCGKHHKACISCWRSLVRVSSSAGDIAIRCPAIGCNAELNSRDAVHIMFDNNADDPSFADTQVLMKLKKFKLNNLMLDQKAKHCPTPSCNHFFLKRVDTAIDEDDRSKSISLCRCGLSLCVQCGQPSHVGVPCSVQKRIRKELVDGSLHSEFQSLLWLKKNTSPCPKCKFPINKNGGCNHMRCSKCNYYFCWLCGGDGYQCGSYRCNKTGILTYLNEINEPSDMNNHLSDPLLSLMSYSGAVENLEKLLKRSEFNGSASVRELELRKMLVWTTGFILSKSISAGINRKNDESKISDTVGALELALSKLEENSTPDEIESIMKAENAITYPQKQFYSKKKVVSKPLQKQIERQREIYAEELPLHEILNFTKLQSMNVKKFNGYTSSLLNQAMDQLMNPRRLRKKRVKKSETVLLLNKKSKTLKAPWKGECRFDYPKVTVVDAKTYSAKKKKEKRPWKGRFRVIARREIALSLREV